MAFYVSRDVHVSRVEGKEFTETPCDFRPTQNDKVYVVTHSPFRKPTQKMRDDELGWISYETFKESA